LKKSKTNPSRWEDGEDVADFNPFTQKTDLAYPQIRWLEALQLDFAARADWCVNNYKNANHAPVVQVKQGYKFNASAGKKILLSALSTDPDGDTLNYKWWQYEEAGTYKGKTSKEVFIVLPNDTKQGDTIHVILEVTDTGVPQLTRYRRIVINIK
jgi:hypothetical protein